MAGDSEAAGARVEASRMRPVHLTSMQGEVLGRKGEGLPFLGGKNIQQFKNITVQKPSLCISQKVWDYDHS